MSQSEFFLCPVVCGTLSIFIVAQDRMTKRCQMGTDLMGPPGNQMNFQKRKIRSCLNRYIFCLNRDTSLLSVGKTVTLFWFSYLFQIPLCPNRFLSFCPTDNRTVIFPHRAVLNHCAEYLQAFQTFSGCNDSARIPIQTVTDGWMKTQKLFLSNRLGL